MNLKDTLLDNSTQLLWWFPLISIFLHNYHDDLDFQFELYYAFNDNFNLTFSYNYSYWPSSSTISISLATRKCCCWHSPSERWHQKLPRVGPRSWLGSDPETLPRTGTHLLLPIWKGHESVVEGRPRRLDNTAGGEGCIQGCVFGPFVFGFASKEAYDLVLEVLKDIPDSFFGAYSDDSAISS